MAKQIPLTQGQVAWVDDEDYDWAMQWDWCATWKGHTWYACRYEGKWHSRKTIFLHREIMKAPDGVQVDHEDRDGRNNQRRNLRLATGSQNQWNRGPDANNTSGYKGVTRDKGGGKWKAQITARGRYIYLGLFDDPADAARAYDSAARKHHGDFGYQNFPEEN